MLKENENLTSEIDILEEELINVKKENGELICEKNFLQEKWQLKNEMNIETYKFLNQIIDYIEANGELEKKIKVVRNEESKRRELLVKGWIRGKNEECTRRKWLVKGWTKPIHHWKKWMCQSKIIMRCFMPIVACCDG